MANLQIQFQIQIQIPTYIIIPYASLAARLRRSPPSRSGSRSPLLPQHQRPRHTRLQDRMRSVPPQQVPYFELEITCKDSSFFFFFVFFGCNNGGWFRHGALDGTVPNKETGMTSGRRWLRNLRKLCWLYLCPSSAFSRTAALRFALLILIHEHVPRELEYAEARHEGHGYHQRR